VQQAGTPETKTVAAIVCRQTDKPESGCSLFLQFMVTPTVHQHAISP
jgi:hypothetical protein